MRGIGSTLSRLPAARALIAGAAFLAGAFASAAGAQAQTTSGIGDEAAMALPRLPHASGDGVALPQPLAPSDAARIRRIFALQDRGKNADADRETKLLGDTILTGHILSDRYLGPTYRTSPDELEAWLARYLDQPDAPAIRALLLAKRPGGPAPPVPPGGALEDSAPATPVPEDAEAGDAALARNAALDRAVLARAQAGRADLALRLIGATKGLRPSYVAQLRAEVAQVQFTLNDDEGALETALIAMRRASADEQVGLAGYMAGLAAWRLGRTDLALRSFETAAKAANSSSSLRAAAAFWTARAYLRSGDPGAFSPWMRKAAKEPRTLYGLIARRMLGIGGGFAWNRQTLSSADIDAVAATPQGQRAFALLQVGQPDSAEAELRALWPGAKDSASLRNALMLVAREAGFSDLSAQIAAIVQVADGRPRDFDRFPVPKLRPRGGFSVDPALVYALTRLESNFDPGAVSPVGARGLMQLMPVTAGYIAGDDVSGARLHDPGVNLELGQRYVKYLAEREAVDGGLIALLASYNSGPGNFARWSAAVRDQADPLLFIEAIPVSETRRFVQHVLTYTWIYAERLHLPTPTLDEMAAGAFPTFTPLAKGEKIAEVSGYRLH